MTLASRLSYAARHTVLATMVLFLFSPALVRSQEILIEQDVMADTIEDSFGPNRQQYAHVFLSLGSIALGDRNSAANKLFDQQTEFGFGIRYKRKLTDWLDIGADLQYQRIKLSIAQNPGKSFPDTNIYHRQDLRRGTIPASLFFRINYGRRGDYIAKFVDLGAYAELRVMERTVRWENTMSDTYRKVIEHGMDFSEQFLYGIYLRAGWNKYSLICRYRLSPLMSTSSGIGDLVPLTLGFQFGFHK